jgi:RimJ/RimL family protein N-acetyltransferase
LRARGEFCPVDETRNMIIDVTDVTLRRVREEDLDFLERLIGDPEWSGEFLWYGASDVGRVRRRWAENGLLDENGLCVQVVAGGQERLGLVTWRKLVTGSVSHCWEIGITLAPDARGRGHGAAAQRALAEHTLLNRVQAVTEIDHLAEQRSLETAGFAREGVMRGYGFRDGRWRDAVLYAVVRGDLDDPHS